MKNSIPITLHNITEGVGILPAYSVVWPVMGITGFASRSFCRTNPGSPEEKGSKVFEFRVVCNIACRLERLL
jgi:hypothetical protein